MNFKGSQVGDFSMEEVFSKHDIGGLDLYEAERYAQYEALKNSSSHRALRS
jgi:hypothetical protein